jgi:hypothetical protein
MRLTTGAEALFTSLLQPSEHPSPRQISAAIGASLRVHHGARGCAAACAVEYGNHPETAVVRMRWALAEVGALVHDHAAA